MTLAQVRHLSKSIPVSQQLTIVTGGRMCTLGLNNPGNHTECGVEMLPAVQLFSCSYLFKMSCKSTHQGETASQQPSAHGNTSPSLTMYQDVNENTSWYRVDTCAIHKAGTVLVAIPTGAHYSGPQFCAGIKSMTKPCCVGHICISDVTYPRTVSPSCRSYSVSLPVQEGAPP